MSQPTEPEPIARTDVNPGPEPALPPASPGRGARAFLGRWYRRVRGWAAQVLPSGGDAADVWMGLGALLAWFVFFGVGFSLSSAPLIGRLNNLDTGVVRGFFLILQIVSVFTVTNVGILSMLSALIGAIARRLSSPEQRQTSRSMRYFHALVGAFLIFLITMGGAYTLLGVGFSPPPESTATEPAGAASPVEVAQKKYENLAAIASILCLVEGFAPFALTAISKRITGQSNT